jgi:hypothetical protein
MFCALDHIGHFFCCLDGERVSGETCSRGDIGRHFTCDLDLSIGPFGEQCYDQVLQRDYTNPKVHEFGVRQIRDLSVYFV